MLSKIGEKDCQFAFLRSRSISVIKVLETHLDGTD